MRRAVLASLVAGVTIAVAWLRVEQPLAAPARAAVLVLLAVAAAALPSRRSRAAGSVVAALVALRLAFGVWLPLHPASAGHIVWSHFDGGVADFYSTHLPFAPVVHVDMAEVVLLAVFVFTLAVALCVSARRPVAAVVVLLAGAGWPATLLDPARGIWMGAAILGAALVVLATAGSRRVSGYAVPIALALVLGGVAVGSAAASRNPVLHWQSWNLAHAGGGSQSVRFVWDARYGGLNWPKTATPMLDVRTSTEPGYLRAAVLDDFVKGRWIAGPPRMADALEPAAAFRPANQTKETVTVDGLVATRLAGGSVPVRFAAGTPLLQPERGLAKVPSAYGSGFTYNAWSYAASPSARALSRSPAQYPAALIDGGMLDIGDGIRLPPFGVPGRDAEVESSLRFNFPDYLPLARTAERVTRGAQNPYAAVVDLERWFLVGGGFTYSDHPRVVAPPLVGFVTTTRSGYCQYFAGAMALMLRYSGIPARVAVGFAGPTYDAASKSWTFTDHDAHAWVEVWFKGYGWLPFDPTPATTSPSRARLIARYRHTRGGGRGRSGGGGGGKGAPPPKGPGLQRNHLGGRPVAQGAPPPVAPARGGGGGFPYGLAVFLVVAGTVGLIALAKEGRRRIGRLARDPRRVAAAYREELASFLVDQGIEAPPSATIRELGLLAERELGAEAHDFTRATTAARFGRPEAAAGAAAAARAELGPLLASCRHFLRRRDRLRGLLSLRSLARIRPAVDGSLSLGKTEA